ncbi:hypothetical protein V0M98_35015 (plasmid) [Pseudomonas silesiensis]|uniref:hypothetical protein n=1 Tax=Pseudomonas silesiensis TaxID=1853130 RepID=UPI0030D0A386
MTDNTPTNEISDEEIEASMLRLARSEAYTTLPQLLAATHECYPELTEQRIHHCAMLLRDRFRDSDHGGYWTEYLRQQRRRSRT